MNRKLLCLLLAALCLLGCARRELPSASSEPTAALIPALSASPGESSEPTRATEPSIPPDPTQTTEPTAFRSPEPPKSDAVFVSVAEHFPQLKWDLKYAGEDNFTNQVIYGFSQPYLRYGTARKLDAAAQELRQQGLTLVIWDAFRPVSAQFQLWEVCPDPTYVADPTKTQSSHSRGNTVDVTLADLNGNLLEMPTGFDDFSPLADRNYSDCTDTAAKNAMLLQQTLEKHGFTPYYNEWWHFSDKTSYPVDTFLDPALAAIRYTSLDTELLENAGIYAPALAPIPAGAEIHVLGQKEGFALVVYDGWQGYLPEDQMQDSKYLG